MADAWNSGVGRRIRRLAFERDKAADAPCWLCHGPIDYSLGPYDRKGTTDAWEPDHVKPRDRYPELALDLANIAPSHAKCNRSRGKKAGLNELGEPTRDWFRIK